MKAPLPVDEWQRLAALRNLDILDTVRESSFDDLSQLATELLQTPIAVVSLVDDNRQWFKSCVGLDTRETPRDVAFCAHAILDPRELLVVQDATLDPRFRDNALVTGPPGIRFYAGVPLVSNGYPIGTMCVMDTKPRALTDSQRRALNVLGRQVVALIELRARDSEAAALAERLQSKFRKLHALYEIASAVITSSDIESLQRQIVDLIAATLPASRVTLILFEADRQCVSTFLKGGRDANLVVEVSYEELQHGLSGWVLQHNRPALSPHSSPDPREAPDVQMRRAATQCGDIIVVPVSYRGQVFGTITAINNSNDPIFEDGDVDLVAAMASHVAVALKTARALADSDARALAASRLAAIVEGSDDSIVSKTLDGVVLSWNKGAEKIFGYSAEEMIGQPLTRIIPNARLDEESALMATIRKGDSVSQYSTQRVRNNGALIEVSLTLSPVFDEHGQVIAVSKIARDITLAKQQEHALQDAIARADHANSAKSQFLANVSHEIRTPLNAVIGFGYLLEQTRLSKEQSAVVNKIRFAGRSLLSVVNNVLDLSKIEAGEMTLELRVFDLVAMTNDISQMLLTQARAKGLNLIVRTAPELPSKLVGDEGRLRQILTNLLNNAIKFTEHGHVQIDVTCQELTSTMASIRCTVRDTGIGIAADAITRLFVPFSQADEAIARRFGGTGLGLSIAKRLVELMGGQIGVDSTVGQGSEFWLRIPLRIATDLDDTATLKGLRPLQLLVVEPTHSSDPLCSLVRALGWDANVVNSSEQALSRMRSGGSGALPDLILVDGETADINPLGLMAALKAAMPHLVLPPLLVVADPKQTFAHNAHVLQAARAVLTRPVTSSTLFNAVNATMAKHGADRESLLAVTDFSHTGAQWLPGVRLLVVDDNEINREVAERILRQQGAEVVTCADGSEALATLKESPEKFDIVLMDVQMPNMDGNEAAARIRKDLGLTSLPIVALTAGALTNERDRSLNAGMDAFVSKPFEPPTLIRIVRRLVERSRGTPLAITIADAESSRRSALGTGMQSIDSTVAQQIFGGDDSLFNSVLARVLRDFGEFALPIQVDPSDASTRKQLSMRLHKLRGSAGMIGATAVQRLAGATEQSVEEGQPPELVEELLSKLAAAFTSLREDAWPLLSAAAAAEETGLGDTPPSPPASDEALADFLALLEAQNLDAIDRLKSIASGLKAKLGKVRFSRVTEAVDNLDFNVAAQLLRGPPAAEGLSSSATSASA